MLKKYLFLILSNICTFFIIIFGWIIFSQKLLLFAFLTFLYLFAFAYNISKVSKFKGANIKKKLLILTHFLSIYFSWVAFLNLSLNNLNIYIISIIIVIISSIFSYFFFYKISQNNENNYFVLSKEVGKHRVNFSLYFIFNYLIIIVSAVLMYIIDFTKLEINYLTLYIFSIIVLLSLFIYFTNELVKMCKGKKAIFYILLHIIANSYFYFLGIFIGRNMAISIFFLPGLLIYLPYYKFTNTLYKRLLIKN